MAEDVETEDTSSEDSGDETSRKARIIDVRRAAVGGVVAAAIGLITRLAVGGIGPWEAKQLLADMLPTTRFLCSSVMTASATILALLLTLLSVGSGSENKFRDDFYQRVLWLAKFDTAAFIAATIVLLAAILPIDSSDEVPSEWFVAIYYTMVSINAMIGGLIVTIVLMLFSTVSDVVQVVALGSEDNPYRAKEK